jgi:hypothetical protein
MLEEGLQEVLTAVFGKERATSSARFSTSRGRKLAISPYLVWLQQCSTTLSSGA